ncbi:MAG: hypothetical protein HRU03_05840 [Nanoarchaeales archaeon]|nr:hypothetical protein [Nanoarchaeales archaeon]
MYKEVREEIGLEIEQGSIKPIFDRFVNNRKQTKSDSEHQYCFMMELPQDQLKLIVPEKSEGLKDPVLVKCTDLVKLINNQMITGIQISQNSKLDGQKVEINYNKFHSHSKIGNYMNQLIFNLNVR